jgi:hypothetical protein
VNNRLLWTVIGLLLTALGVFGLLLSYGRVPRTDQTQPLLWPELLDRWRDYRSWALGGAAILGLLAILLGWLLLRGQFRRRGGHAMPDMLVGTRNGRTLVGSATMARSLAHDLEQQPGIAQANVRLAGDQSVPHLVVSLTIDADTSISQARQDVQAAVNRFVRTTAVRPGNITVGTGITRSPAGRVA